MVNIGHVDLRFSLWNLGKFTCTFIQLGLRDPFVQSVGVYMWWYTSTRTHNLYTVTGDVGHRHKYSFSFLVPWLSRSTWLVSMDLEHSGLLALWWRSRCRGWICINYIFTVKKQHQNIELFCVFICGWRLLGHQGKSPREPFFLLTVLVFLLNLWLLIFLNQSYPLCCAYCTFKQCGCWAQSS